jgi:hypothetical protein
MKIKNGLMTKMNDTLTDELQIIANYFADAKSHDLEQTVLAAISRIKTLNEQVDWYRDRVVWGFYEEGTPQYYQGKTGEHEINDPVTAKQVNNLVKALEIYERERERFRHSKPEITGAYFLAGGYGETDANQLPQFVRIVPAYGCAWEQIYEKTERTVSYEGS